MISLFRGLSGSGADGPTKAQAGLRLSQILRGLETLQPGSGGGGVYSGPQV